MFLLFLHPVIFLISLFEELLTQQTHCCPVPFAYSGSTSATWTWLFLISFPVPSPTHLVSIAVDTCTQCVPIFCFSYLCFQKYFMKQISFVISYNVVISVANDPWRMIFLASACDGTSSATGGPSEDMRIWSSVVSVCRQERIHTF